MAIWGYKPKHRKAPWVGVQGLSQCGVSKNGTQPQASFIARRGPKKQQRRIPWKKTRPGAVSARNSGLKNSPRKPIRRESKVYASQKTIYRREAREFVRGLRRKGYRCPVVSAVPELRNGHKYGHAISDRLSQCHHIYGRGHGGRGPLLLDKRLWLAVSREGHRYIDSHREIARSHGWLAPEGKYNTPVSSGASVTRNQWHGVVVEEIEAQP